MSRVPQPVRFVGLAASRRPRRSGEKKHSEAAGGFAARTSRNSAKRPLRARIPTATRGPPDFDKLGCWWGYIHPM